MFTTWYSSDATTHCDDGDDPRIQPLRQPTWSWTQEFLVSAQVKDVQLLQVSSSRESNRRYREQQSVFGTAMVSIYWAIITSYRRKTNTFHLWVVHYHELLCPTVPSTPYFLLPFYITERIHARLFEGSSAINVPPASFKFNNISAGGYIMEDLHQYIIMLKSQWVRSPCTSTSASLSSRYIYKVSFTVTKVIFPSVRPSNIKVTEWYLNMCPLIPLRCGIPRRQVNIYQNYTDHINPCFRSST